MAVARLRSAAARVRPALAGAIGERRLLGAAAAAAEVTTDAAAAVAAGVSRWEPMGAREYYDYRRAIYGDITHKAILVDAAGTLLAPTEPMAQVRSIPIPASQILALFRLACCACDPVVCMSHFWP